MRFKTTVEGMEVALIITEPVIDTSWPLITEGKGAKLGHRNGQFVRGAFKMEVASSIVTTWTISDCWKYVSAFLISARKPRRIANAISINFVFISSYFQFNKKLMFNQIQVTIHTLSVILLNLLYYDLVWTDLKEGFQYGYDQL